VDGALIREKNTLINFVAAVERDLTKKNNQRIEFWVHGSL
jgi:hypothetical protein